MRSLDFSFLNEFAGKNAKVVVKLDPNYNRKKEQRDVFGKLFKDQTYSVSIGEGLHTLEHQSGRFEPIIEQGHYCGSVWSTDRYGGGNSLPYLGVSETVWEIELIDEKKIIFHHEQMGREDYVIYGPNNRVLGRVTGVPFPYKTDYNPLEKDPMVRFNRWRKEVLQVF